MTELSIAIVTMNRPEVLEETLDHLDQLGLADKVIIVDGSDGEKTRDVCADHEVDYHRQDSTGMTSARNEALKYCETEYIAFIDDDVRVSEDWFNAISEAFNQEDVVGVTGKLEDEELDLGRIAGKFRSFLFGSKDDFGEIKNNGIINGDFFYDETKEVDHMPGCNMAYHVPTLKQVGGFQEEYDAGNSYREDTVASYLIGQEGKIVYNSEASVDHLAVDEQGDEKKWMFYNPYMTKYFLHSNDVVSGIRNRLSYFVNMAARHVYFSMRSLANLNTSYLYYLYGEIRSFIDLVVLGKEPKEHV